MKLKMKHFIKEPAALYAKVLKIFCDLLSLRVSVKEDYQLLVHQILAPYLLNEQSFCHFCVGFGHLAVAAILNWFNSKRCPVVNAH